MDLTWLLVATGFTGGLTFVFLVRALARGLGMAPVVSVQFAAQGAWVDEVVRHLQRARREVLVQAHILRCRPIAQALVEAKGRGVQIQVMVNQNGERDAQSDVGFLQEQGLPPLLDVQNTLPPGTTLILDGRTVLTGTFTLTAPAATEQMLTVHRQPELVASYRRQFEAGKPNCQLAGQKTERTGTTPTGSAARDGATRWSGVSGLRDPSSPADAARAPHLPPSAAPDAPPPGRAA